MANKHKILIMGAGKIGVTVASLLARTNDYESYLSDIRAPHKLPEIAGNPIKFIPSDIRKTDEIKKFILDNQIEGVISCLPFHLTIEVAKIAAETGIHYFDPTEDVATTNKVYELAKTSKGSFAPQCGLAPGFISIAANSLTDGFEEIDHIKMRVGALTPNVNNNFHYAFTWSIDGVVNEYIHPCVVMQDGERKLVPALEGYEHLVVDNEHYEAFFTSGGVGSLVESYSGRAKNMDYKTMRYVGHCEKMKFILQDMNLREDPELAKQILTKVIPHTEQDKVVVYVSVFGKKNGVLSEVTYTNTCYPLQVDNTLFTAIQMTTAAGICTIVDLVVHEKKLSGLVKQEQVSLKEFLANRFGSYYKSGEK